MKKMTALLLLGLLILPSVSYAQVALETPTPATRMQKAQEMRLTLQEKRKEFQEKLQTIKDQRKLTIVKNIDEKMQTINKRRTDHMGNVVDTLSDILDRVSSKAAVAKTQGIDTTQADQAIMDAEAALELADDAISSQAAENYIIPIQDETTLKNIVGQTISTLNQDLRNLFTLVKSAQQKVVIAARTVATLQLKTEDASPSAE